MHAGRSREGSSGAAWVRRLGGLMRGRRLDAVLVFFISLVFLLCLEGNLRFKAREGIYFQEWSSEEMMQTVSIQDLRDKPFRSLWYLHVSPPLGDAVRAAVAAFHPSEGGRTLVEAVDRTLYVLWAIAYALVCAIACAWVSGVTSHRLAGIAAALAVMLHPAMIFYATMLDTTMLSTLVFTWMAFELWRFCRGYGSTPRLATAFVAAYLTRSVFQWPALLVLLACLVLARASWKKTLIVVGIAAGVVAGYTIKQSVLFGIPYTSSFAGMNFCRAIGGCEKLGKNELAAADAFLHHQPPADAAEVLSRDQKLKGVNYNALPKLADHKRELLAYGKTISHRTLSEIADVLGKNTRRFLDPSSQYTPHVIVDALPWRQRYDVVFSKLPLLELVSASLLWWIWRNRRWRHLRRGLAVGLLVGYIGVVSIVFERGENQRFKFFIEPILIVLIVSQATDAACFIATLLRRKLVATTTSPWHRGKWRTSSSFTG